MKIKLNTPLRASSAADERDVRTIKRTLNWLGYYIPHTKIGLSDVSDHDVFSALRAFQGAHNLPETGIIKPEDDTLRALNAALQKRLKGGAT